MTASVAQFANSSCEELVRTATDLMAAGRLDLLHSCCLLGVSRFPDSAELLALLGWCYAQSSDPANAEATFRHALSIDESLAEAHAGLAAVLAKFDRYQEADEHYRRAARLGHVDAPTLFNHGCTLLSLGRPGEAVTALRRAIELDPTSADAYHNLGVGFGQLGRWNVALEACQRALALHPTAWQVRLLRGMSRLALGSFAEGWDDYEARLNSHGAYQSMLRLPHWQGRPDRQQSIAVIPEQGIGTQIMFASCIEDLAQAVPHCAVGCDPRLIKLFRRSFPSVEVVAGGALPAIAEIDNIDCCTLAGSLPKFFRRSQSAFPGRPYLTADPLMRRRWKKRLSELGPGAKIGISWRGGLNAFDSRHRSTQCSDWGPVFELPHVRWINLQHDAQPEELAEWAEAARQPIQTWDDLDQKHNLEGLSALVAELDLVITVVNSTVHLAGALGVPTWALVPAGGEWRWQTDGDTCPWHDSVRLVRQSTLGDWSDVFARIRQQLTASNRLPAALLAA